MQAVRISLILGNTVAFAALATIAFVSSRKERNGLRLLYRAGAAAAAAVAVGGLQRLLLQAVLVDVLPQEARFFILEDQALIQAVVVGGLGLVAWRSFGQARDRVSAADDLLAAFGGDLPDLDWSGIHLTAREETVADLIARGVLRDSDLAAELMVSPETVRSHVKAIIRKTGLKGRQEIAIAVHQRGRSGSAHG